MKKYPIILVCGNDNFLQEQKNVLRQLTLDGNIVISSVWDRDFTDSKIAEMLFDMQKSKIELADEVLIVDPEESIEEELWSGICYASMLGKKIRFLRKVSYDTVIVKVKQHLMLAERLAARQYDYYSHVASDYDESLLLKDMVTLEYKGCTTVDPWVPEDKNVPVVEHPFINHAAPKSGYDPFKVYGKKKMARFVEDIITDFRKTQRECGYDEAEELLEEVEWYLCVLDMPKLPKNYPDMSILEMQDFIDCWSDFDPCPELD